MRLLKLVVAVFLLVVLAGADSYADDKASAPAQMAAAAPEAAAAPAIPQFAKVFGTVNSINAQQLVVTLKDPAQGGASTETITMTEWTRVVRENEDLTIADVKAGDSVEVVCELKDGAKEAVMVCLPKL